MTFTDHATDRIPTPRTDLTSARSVSPPTAPAPAVCGPAGTSAASPGQAPGAASRTAPVDRTGEVPRASAPRGRDRYIDSLRALALLRVVTYHLFGWIWLPIVFPSMGLMFALAGSLVAASLDRETRHWGYVLAKRFRRLLPPLWVLGLVLLPLMYVLGWTDPEDATTNWTDLVNWVVPFTTPPASVEGTDWVVPLWYISTYMWFVLLSPMYLWLVRRWTLRTIAVPMAVVFLATAGLLRLEGPTGDAIEYVCMYAPAWAIGFLHHDGTLRRMRRRVVLPLGAALAAAGVAWAFAFPDPDGGPNVSDVPVAAMLFSAGTVLILLRLYLDFSWMARIGWLDALVGAVNSRAMTIYLWGNAAIAAALWLLDTWPVTHPYVASGGVTLTSGLLAFAATWAVLAVCVLAFGWVEDVAARRRPRLFPIGRPARRAADRDVVAAARER